MLVKRSGGHRKGLSENQASQAGGERQVCDNKDGGRLLMKPLHYIYNIQCILEKQSFRSEIVIYLKTKIIAVMRTTYISAIILSVDYKVTQVRPVMRFYLTLLIRPNFHEPLLHFQFFSFSFSCFFLLHTISVQKTTLRARQCRELVSVRINGVSL